ncbi:TraR/DksA family transcriptional regulator [Aestuariimicrobium ganziense]|uniref:TraR/DksA family transcriptional regulator n=1 Tax=Aestuariimicrobium ganziense TaxID=2773677 RepID=UPI0019430F0D|nr:TraR/DksA C4-type zinc finger protein [Aestuariimicrobium ganziense]
MTVPDLAEVSAELDAKAAQLRAELARLTTPVDSDTTIGFGKRIGDGTTQAIGQMEDASVAQNAQTVLDQVNRARHKLIEGSYGRCDVCDRPIGEARLEFRPWSTTCVDHA